MGNIFKTYIGLLLTGIAVVVLGGCSSQKNTAKSRFWHSFNTKYNIYYNGSLAYIDGSLEKEEGNKDNYTELLPLYYVGNKNSRELGKANFDRAIEKSQKAIQRHSIKRRPEWTKNRRKTEKDIEWLNRKEYNPFMWKVWMLMGRSQFHQAAFDEAASTFAYMSRLFQTQPAIYGKAQAWLAKCYVEEGWLYDAEDVIRNMRRDSVDWRARKEWDYTLADYYLHTGELSQAVPYLQKVIKHEMRRKQKAREWYLLGQVQAALGHQPEAYKAFKHVIRLNPPYELEFNARISMTEVLAKGKSSQMVRRLKRMAASDNNKDYLDQVYYAIGNIYLSNGDTAKAISAYEQGNKKATRSGIEKGVLLLHLGDLYWQLEKYSDARRCYGEAIGLLDKDRKDYQQLSDRSKVLDELVPYTDAVQLQDSLQALAKMSEADRNAAIDRVIDALKKKEKEEQAKQAEQEAEQRKSEYGGQQNNTAANRPTNAAGQQSTGQWYFYNQMAVNQGKTTFQRLWGNRKNEDNWQRSNKTVIGQELTANTDSLANLTDEQRDSLLQAEIAKDSLQNIADSAQNDPHKREYYLAQIPFTPEQVAASNKILEDGLHHAGVIFKDKLDNLPKSEKFLRRLTDNYSDYEHMDEVFYHLFLLYSRLGQSAMAQNYIDSLKARYPESQWTQLLTDPYFAENARFGTQMEDSLYAATYNAFKADRFAEVAANAKLSEQRFPMGANRDKFLFIGGLSKLNNGDANGCVADMKTVVEKYPQSRISELAGMIVNGVNSGKRLRGGKFDLGDVWTRRAATLSDSAAQKKQGFSTDLNTDFMFLLVYNPDSINENQLLFQMARFNFTNFLVRNFDINIEQDGGLHRMEISGFRNFEEAFQYARQLYANKAIAQLAAKARPVLISSANLPLLGQAFSYKEYDDFYAKNFRKVKVPEYRLLDEPAEISVEKQPEEEQPEQDELGEPVDDGMNIVPETESGNQQQEQNGAELVIPDNNTATGNQSQEQNANGIVVPDANATNGNQPQGQNENEIVVPDNNAATGNAQQEQNGIVIPETEPETNGANENGADIVIPEETTKAPVPMGKTAEPTQKATETQPVESQKQTVSESNQHATTNSKPQQPVQPKVQEPEPPANNDEPDIYFDDTPTAPQGGNNNTNNNSNGSNDYDLEDEYYDLDGF